MPNPAAMPASAVPKERPERKAKARRWTSPTKATRWRLMKSTRGIPRRCGTATSRRPASVRGRVKAASDPR